MASQLFHRLFPGMALVAAGWFGSSACEACPFCTMSGQTLTGELKQASMVLFGTVKNAKADLNDFGGGTTEFHIEEVVKPHEIAAGKKMVLLPRYVPPTEGNYKFLIFCDVYKGKIDPYRGVAVKPTTDIVEYLKGCQTLPEKDAPARLRFFFKYLDNDDIEISNDAYKEFGNSDYADYREMARDLPAEKIIAWLRDPKTPSFRYGLYASMLAHCGTAKDAVVLREMLDDPQKNSGSGIDGILAGYVMLDRQQGWNYLRFILKDPKKEFLVRYAALRAIRFFWEYRPDVVDPKELVAAACDLLDQSDIADLAIEDLRKWRRWEVAERVLGLFAKKSHDVPIIRRAIMRYALSCPDNKAAQALVQQMRAKDPEWVKDIEELLRLEVPPPAASPAPAAVGGK